MMWPRQIFWQYIKCLRSGKDAKECAEAASATITKENYSDPEGVKNMMRIYMGYMKKRQVRFEQRKQKTQEKGIAAARRAINQ